MTDWKPQWVLAEGAYVFSGHSQPDVQFKANTIRTTAKGESAPDCPSPGKCRALWAGYHEAILMLLKADG